MISDELRTKSAQGYLMPGWRRAAWAARLRQLANRCQSLHPELTAAYRQWATKLEGGPQSTGGATQ